MIKDYLESLGFKIKEEGSQLRVDCPQCGDQSQHLYICPKKRVGFCHKCTWKPNLFKLAQCIHPDWDNRQVVDYMKRYDLIKSKQPDKPKKTPKLRRDDIRQAEDTDLSLLCEIKRLSMDALKKFFPWIHTEQPWMMLPAYMPGHLQKACGLMRVHLKGELIHCRNGRDEKYPMVPGSEHGLFGLKWIQEENPQTLIFAEAWRDALAAIAQGFYATASSGGASTFREEWLPLFRGREVYICMDADKAGVRAAERALEKIKPVAKSVKIVWLPYEFTESHGKDLHDYLTMEGHHWDDLMAIQTDAAKRARDYAKQMYLLPDNRPGTIARAYIEWSGRIYRHKRDMWLEWDGHKYSVVRDSEMTKRLWKYIELVKCDNGKAYVPLKASDSTIKTILSAMSALDTVWMADDVELPAWIDGQAGRPDPASLISMNNGLLDITHNPPSLMDHDPAFITLNHLFFAYDPDAACPNWDYFLPQVICEQRLRGMDLDATAGEFKPAYEWTPIQEDIDMLMEFVGLLMTAETKYQKILGLVGPKRSGKGTILRIIYKLLGNRNCTMPTLGSLSTQGGLQSLIGKTAALITDASSGGKKFDMATAVERLKGISGEDPITIDPKFKEPIDLPKLSVRFVITANSIQQLTDTTGALASRFLFVQTGRSYLGQEDLDLERKLEAELPGIFNAAIAALFRLKARGRFLESERSRMAGATAAELGSPLIAFFREACEYADGLEVERKDLYDHYCKWTKDSRRGLMGRNKFFEEFERTFPECPKVKKRDVWAYLHVKMRELQPSLEDYNPQEDEF
ncbi:MAG TPA: DUF5906 domain-containing protein [Anaerohalosphaeraceae bacterium]|nr:DUF5906 domain-containing protein [Anaerohalosphaeraceae bacterium]